MRRKINIQGHIDREREYSKKFGQLAKYEMIDGNLSWEEAKKVTRHNILFAIIKHEIRNGKL